MPIVFLRSSTTPCRWFLSVGGSCTTRRGLVFNVVGSKVQVSLFQNNCFFSKKWWKWLNHHHYPQAGITAGISLAVLVPVACCIVCLLQRSISSFSIISTAGDLVVLTVSGVSIQSSNILLRSSLNSKNYLQYKQCKHYKQLIAHCYLHLWWYFYYYH